MIDRRTLLAGAPAALAVPVSATEAGPIEARLLEFRRRNDWLNTLPTCSDEMVDSATEWIDEPLNEACGMTPETMRELAALFLLTGLDNENLCEPHLRPFFTRCEAMLR
ncbi:MAG: hypothetical protein AAGK02_02550 [Pseudomonadota bacterium]